jgi:hypothetical protein
MWDLGQGGPSEITHLVVPLSRKVLVLSRSVSCMAAVAATGRGRREADGPRVLSWGCSTPTPVSWAARCWSSRHFAGDQEQVTYLLDHPSAFLGIRGSNEKHSSLPGLADGPDPLCRTAQGGCAGCAMCKVYQQGVQRRLDLPLASPVTSCVQHGLLML